MPSDDKIIVMLIHSLQAGGMERVIAELANYFSEIKHTKVHLVLYGRYSEEFYTIDNRVVVHIPKDRFNNNIRFIETIRRMYYVRRNIIQIKPDSILSFGIPWNSFVLLSLIGTRYPVFVSDRGSPQRKFSFGYELMRKKLYRHAAGIIAQTSIAKDIILKILPGSNIKVIGNPIRLSDDYNRFIERENIILSIGRLINTKHHDKLIKIFSKLEAPGWKLIIVGGDAIKQNNLERLHKLVADLKLVGRVQLEGEQKNVETYYMRSKIFAFTSSVEGFPNVIGEALSAGLPVVSYDCITGPSEMISDGENGFLIPVFNDELFQKRLQLLIDNKDLLIKMSKKSNETIKRFSINSIGMQYYSFIMQTD